MRNVLLAPSLLSSDFTNMRESIKRIETGGGSFIHIDVMDGSFVPEITYGQPFVRAIRKLTTLPFDIHLMVEHPETEIESFAKAGADYITFHHENTIHQHRLVQKIHSLGKKAGMCIVPSTPVSAIQEMLPYLDVVLVMTVNPGFGGQILIPNCVHKIEELDKIRRNKGYGYILSVDGGINENTVQSVIDAGVDVVVSGSAFFSGTLKWSL